MRSPGARRFVPTVALAAVLAACNASTSPPPAATTAPNPTDAASINSGTPAPLATRPTPQLLGYERTFGPTYPAVAPNPERAVRIDRATLSADRLTLTVEFVGGVPWNPNIPGPCTTDYAPWLAPRGDELDVVVVHVPHERPDASGPMVFCTLEGHFWQFHLLLAEPFAGTTIRDLGGGGTLLVGPPAGTALLRVVPPGWLLQAQFQMEPGPPPMWTQIYAPGPVDPIPDEGPGRLVFYQAFGIVGEWTDTRAVKSEDRGGSAVDVVLLGRPAKVWVDPAIGELLLGWDVGGRSYGLIGNLADMSVDDLVRYAESVGIPG